ncbi:MAG: hypothetical protein KAS59_05815 [Alphaproteobacteria bacterium]|nr:hypothetical protein [Alphaproteobacteria bacterium]
MFYVYRYFCPAPPRIVIPAKAGISLQYKEDSGLRRNNNNTVTSPPTCSKIQKRVRAFYDEKRVIMKINVAWA